VQRTTAKEQARRLIAAAERKEALLRIATAAGSRRQQVAFVTAYQDRGSSGFKKTVSRLAWGSFGWFATEPDHLLVQYEAIGGHTWFTRLLSAHEPPE
jgi:alpha-amylase/alpha-mannosidase (GH57 family)